jgi:hypothetical protein
MTLSGMLDMFVSRWVYSKRDEVDESPTENTHNAIRKGEVRGRYLLCDRSLTKHDGETRYVMSMVKSS